MALNPLIRMWPDLCMNEKSITVRGIINATLFRTIYPIYWNQVNKCNLFGLQNWNKMRFSTSLKQSLEIKSKTVSKKCFLSQKLFSPHCRLKETWTNASYCNPYSCKMTVKQFLYKYFPHVDTTIHQSLPELDFWGGWCWCNFYRYNSSPQIMASESRQDKHETKQ